MNLFNMFSGGALSRFTVFALGIMPYISASIIMQLVSYVVPSFEQLKKEGEAGRRKITQYTRYGTLALGIFQSWGIAVALQSSQGLVLNPGLLFQLTTVISLTAGTMFLMWLGEQITERGLGNGISILIFAGIAAGLPGAIGGMLELVRSGAMSEIVALFICALVVLVTYFVVFVERGQRKNLGKLCPQAGWQQGLRGAVVSFTVKIKYGRRYSADFCFFYYLIAGNSRWVVRCRRVYSLA